MAVLGEDREPPELDERTIFWLGCFGIANRARPVSMGGIPPLNPVDLLTLSDRLGWACRDDECVEVLVAVDDTFRELNSE